MPCLASAQTAVERDEFIKAMALVASSVTVVTTDGPSGRFGQTVSSFCSVSADPPQMLCCLRKESPICAAIDGNGCFAINILSARQACLADSFAGRPTGGSRYDFSSGDWEPDTLGAPVLLSATSSLSCKLRSCIEANTHLIYLGTVVAVGSDLAPPLMYRSQAYGSYLPFY